MLDFAIGFLSFLLVLTCFFVVLVVLLQRASTSAGMGATMGGGPAEQVFGTETTNVLAKSTRWAALLFFLLCGLLYVGHLYRHYTNLKANPLPTAAELGVSTPAATETPATGTAAPLAVTPTEPAAAPSTEAAAPVPAAAPSTEPAAAPSTTPAPTP